MTDDELINNMAENLEKVLNATLEGNGLHAVQNMAIKDKFYRLIELSRIGASVMPKPIEEAPKNGTKILLMGNGPGFWATEGAWVGHASEWRDATSFTFKLVDPHSWLPLSALQVKP